MPEMPEVETVANGLRQGGAGFPSILGRRIQGAELLWPRTLAAPSAAEFLSRLPGQAIEQVGRRGKVLQLRLTQDWLLVHLRMSGDLRVEKQDAPSAAHHRLLLEERPLRLKQLLGSMQSRNTLICAFLALLELVRLQAILLRQDRIFSDIIIKNRNTVT